MEAELQQLATLIDDASTQLKSLPLGHAERPSLQMQLAALRLERATLRQEQGALCLLRLHAAATTQGLEQMSQLLDEKLQPIRQAVCEHSSRTVSA